MNYPNGTSKRQADAPSNVIPLYNTVHSKNYASESRRRTTVFVGNISDNVTDEFMKKLMGACGVFSQWKRVLGSNGKLQSFGFCDFYDQESSLRAMRLLNGFKLGDKSLVVKVDAKTRALLDDYENKNIARRLAQQKYQLPVSAMSFMRSEFDEDAIVLIEKLVEENEPMFTNDSNNMNANANSNNSNSYLYGNVLQKEEGQVSDDDFEFIKGDTKISFSVKFSTAFMEDEDIIYEKKRSERKKMEKEQEFKDKCKRWENYEKNLSDEFKYYQNKLKKKDKRKREFEDKMIKFISNYDDDVDDEKYYKNDAWDEILASRNQEMEKDEQDVLDEQSEIEELKKKKEKELLEKVNSFKTELPKLIPSLNHDDDGDNQTIKSNDMVIENEKTNQNSISELDNVDINIAPSVNSIESENQIFNESNKMIDLLSASANSMNYNIESINVSKEIKSKTVEKTQEWETVNDEHDSLKSKKTFGIKITTAINNNSLQSNVNSVISTSIEKDMPQLEENEKEQIYVKKKTKLTMITDKEHKEVPLVDLPPGYHAESLTPKEKTSRIKKIISSIPIDKDQLFSYKVMWDHVDKTLVNERIKPWISKKIKELIGVEENTLIDFICTKVYQKSSPQELIEAISMILEAETEEFTVKLWRFLIYEATAKMYGLSQCNKPKK